LMNYGYRRKITIDHAKVDSTLTDFPMLVKLYYDSSMSAWTTPYTYSVGDIVKNDGAYYKCLTASTTKEPGTTTDWQDDWQFLGYEFDFNKVESTGYDIRFTASDESTLRSFERAGFTKSSEPYSAMFFVLVPSVSSSAATDIYLYYGYSSATDASAPATVWADYELVSHMGTTLIDATGNHTLTDNGATIVDSHNGKGHEYSEVGDVADSNYYPSGVSAVTMSALFKFNSWPSDDVGGYCGENDASNHKLYLDSYWGGSNRTHSFANGSKYLTGNDMSSCNDSRFHHTCGFTISSTLYGYTDGVSAATAGTFSFSGTSSDAFNIGSRSYNGSVNDYFPGVIDEVRVKLSHGTADWAEIEHADMVRHDLHSIGTEESASQTITGSATLTGTGGLTVGATLEVLGEVVLQGSSELTAAALLEIVAAMQLAGTGVLQATALLKIVAAAILDGSGFLDADGMVEVQGAAALVGSGDLTADGLVEVLGVVILSGTGSLVASGDVQPSAPVLSGEYSAGCINLSW
jgi:hypothetical protein